MLTITPRVVPATHSFAAVSAVSITLEKISPATHSFAAVSVRVCWGRFLLAHTNTHLLEEVVGELVTARQLEHLGVQVDLHAHVEVLRRVVLVVLGRRFVDLLSLDEGACVTESNLFLRVHRLVGLVVKTSASRTADPSSIPAFSRDLIPGRVTPLT